MNLEQSVTLAAHLLQFLFWSVPGTHAHPGPRQLVFAQNRRFLDGEWHRPLIDGLAFEQGVAFSPLPAYLAFNPRYHVGHNIHCGIVIVIEEEEVIDAADIGLFERLAIDISRDEGGRAVAAIFVTSCWIILLSAAVAKPVAHPLTGTERRGFFQSIQDLLLSSRLKSLASPIRRIPDLSPLGLFLFHHLIYNRHQSLVLLHCLQSCVVCFWR